MIGGGAAATLLLAHLAEIPEAQGLSIDVYDRTNRFARGIAYSTQRLCHLLNVRASNMSGFEDKKSHFAEWAEPLGYAASDFVPRRIYGDYLEGLWQGAETRLRINPMVADVLSSCSAPGGFEIAVDNTTYFYNLVILATGNVTPLGPKVSEGIQGYYPDPWKLDDIHLQSKKSVALVGSGLTAVDAALSLLDIGFKGDITIFSHHALLPQTHTAPQSWALSGVKPGDSSLALLRAIRRNIDAAAAQGVPWQSVIDALRPLTNDLWQGFSAVHNASFQRHLATLWNIHRHRMAPEIAKTIEDILGAGRLKFVKMRVQSIESAGPEIRIITRDQKTHAFDAAINCMGYRYEERERNFEASHRIGPACFGDLFETTAIPEIRAQARALAATLA